MSNKFGIEALEIYFPKTFVDQTEFGNFHPDSEIFNKVPQGKYTKGLGQLELSFAYPF
jgi:3-hydroxy-3-methylglutaryl CoA synthase